MENNFEKDIPIELVVVIFVVVSIISFFFQRKLRNRKLAQDGQVFGEKGEILSIEKRLAANSDWSSGRIKSSGAGLMIALWLGSIVWSLTFGVSFIRALSNSEMKTGAVIALGVFSLGGFVFLYYAIKMTLRYFKYGSSTCIIVGKAGVLGQRMTGRVITSVDMRPTSDYVINLDCIEIYQEGSGKNKTTRTNIRWSAKNNVNPLSASSRSGIPFSFEIPKFLPETGYQLSRGQINWQLSISAPNEGVDYHSIFVIPVFKME